MPNPSNAIHRARLSRIRGAYGSAAKAYQRQLGDELKHKPFDRAWLDDFSKRLPTRATVLEVGCASGHIAGYLLQSGRQLHGLDLAPEMIAVAKAAYPTISFTVGNLFALPWPDQSLDGLVAFYSIVNLPPEQVPLACTELSRVLKPGAVITLAFHLGTEVLSAQNWWDTGVDLEFFLHDLDAVAKALTHCGLRELKKASRAPYPKVEAATERGYLLFQRPRGES